MTGGFCWESILEYVSSYNPLDSGVDSACAGFASIGFALSALLSGYSTAKYGYLGYLVLFIQKQGMLCLRTSVIVANFQKGLGALFRVFLVYMAKFRMGLARMTLYTYATFISGSQLLWVSPSKRSYRRLFLVAQLSMLGAGYAGEGSTSYVFQTQLGKAEQKSLKKPPQKPPPPITDVTVPPPINISVRVTILLVPLVRLVRFILGKPHVSPVTKWEARDIHYTEKENTGNSSENNPEQNQERNAPQDTEEEMDSVSIQLQQENARKMRNRIRKKLFAAKLPGTILGTVLAAVFSTEVFIKISTAVTVISYNLFFWMGARCYDLGKMENYDVTDENKSCEMKKQDEKDEEKIDGKDEKQNPAALVPEFKKAVEAVLKLFPLWLTFASTCYLVNATGDSFFMEQVDYLENNTESVKIPESVFYFLPDIVAIITGQVVEQFYDEKKEARWARLLRISIGMLFSSLCCIVASLVAYRLDCNYNSASMLWLLPQFLLWGMMKGILEEGLEEFLHDNLDNDLHDNLDKDLQVLAVCGIAEAVGYFLSMILTAASPSSWVGSDISKSHLGNYYRMLAITIACWQL